MEALNYCRQIATQFSELLASGRGHTPPAVQALLRRIVEQCDQAQKFQLPVNGELLDDPDLRALDETEPLRLPFPSVALEFKPERDTIYPLEAEPVSKVCIFATERAEDEVIVIDTAV